MGRGGRAVTGAFSGKVDAGFPSGNATRQNQPALEVAHLSHSFSGRPALADVSFSVGGGAFTVLLGLNGAGKTTLISLVTGLYHAHGGSVSVFGHGLRAAPLRALAAMGVVFQQLTLDLDLTVRENLRYHASLHGLSKALARERQAAELDRLQIRERADDRIRVLSGGLRRRVEIARALLHRPRLLLLDEPTVGLDLTTRRAILAHVRELCRDDRVSVLWATHLMDEVEDGDHLVLLHRGAVAWDGRARDLCVATGRPTVADAFLARTEGAA
jgi:ABC-2 type transport system ATP-binding protein